MRDVTTSSNGGGSPDELAGLLVGAFAAYTQTFREITRRARQHFERREWADTQVDAAARLALYRQCVDTAVADARRLGGAADVGCWAAAKACFGRAVANWPDGEIAHTFFNSVARRVCETTGSNPAIEFGTEPVTGTVKEAPYVTIETRRLDAAAVSRILDNFPWSVPYADRRRESTLAASIGTAELRAQYGDTTIDRIDVFRAVFYRNKGAYLVTRLQRRGEVLPFILALSNTPRGITIDAAIPTGDEASVVFGFSWSYFHVDVDHPGALVTFLASLMPLKRIDELYTAVGYNRHGKTVFYHDLMRHLRHVDARFELAEGEQGTVMSVFTLPSFNVVFKIIKDAFGYTKKVTRQGVMDRYHFVFVRDRVGRLADAQEFEHLEFPADRFSAALLEHLLAECARTVRVDGDRVIVQHAYTERRVTPLNLYLKEADPVEADEAVLDYGNAIKDLAGADIFTGDMLLKNFGVSRHGRVICYDYDELALLTECNFRQIPRAADNDEEMAAEPYFYVGERDVFPEEFNAFLVPPGAQRDTFLRAHADLLDVEYWRAMQARVKAGEMLDVFPYPAARRLAQSTTPSHGTR
jgi:isocitrate dehydrogenase kinase/phosphatase